MQLNNSITINPPPFSDHHNNIINPEPIILDMLNVTYCDNPTKKIYYASIEKIPTSILLFNDIEYLNAGLINKESAELKLKSILGENPAQYLRSLFPKTLEENPNGPGTILSKMIKSVGIVMTQGCSCRRHALEMNEKGNDWCQENIDTIVGWLKDEAQKRKLPFLDSIGKMIVNRAIKKSRRPLSNQSVPETDEELDNL